MIDPHRLDRLDCHSSVHVRRRLTGDRGARHHAGGQTELLVNARTQVFDEHFDSTTNRKIGRNDMENVDAFFHRIPHLDEERTLNRAVVTESNTRFTLGEFGQSSIAVLFAGCTAR